MKIETVFCFILAILGTIGVWFYFNWAYYGHLPEKVETLQKEVDILKYAPDSSKTYLLDLKKLEIKIDKVEQGIRADFFMIQRIGVPVTILAFILLFWSIYKSSLGFALQSAKETIDRYYLQDEERFKIEKKLLILTKEGADSGFIRKLLKDTGFLTISTIPKENVKKLDEETLVKILDGKTFDLIFLNNELQPFDDAEIKTCFDQTSSSTIIFSFAKNLPGEVVVSQRAASANFKSQIYGNIINALKYQQFLKKGLTDNKV